MQRWAPIVGGALALVLIIFSFSLVIIDERERGLVIQFGEVKREVSEPGLTFIVPFIQEVARYDDRILPVETSELEVTPADERRLVVDAFARWRIADARRFRQAVQTRFSAEQRLGQILNDALRQVLGSVPQADVLSPERGALMRRIRDVARRQAVALGVEVVDVRIRRADLPEQNLQATFARMTAEREREAADERARGRERAQEVRATAERQATEIVSEAQRQSNVIRGEADAERNRIFAEAFSSDPEFFAFYRSLAAYEKALKGSNSTLVISPNSEFFDYLGGAGAVPPSALQDLAAVPEAGAEDADGDGDGDDAGATDTPAPEDDTAVQPDAPAPAPAD
ncbi:MAG: protease modulator HflC [Pseudomonadota bacterium]